MAATETIRRPLARAAAHVRKPNRRRVGSIHAGIKRARREGVERL
jgi:hypothetical protein